MATSIRTFNAGLYREHLMEVSFLYDQRQVWLHDPEVNWPDLQSLEERAEAHVDALVLGGDLAIDVCRQQAMTGDAGEAHAALLVFCRQGREDEAFGLLRALDLANEEFALAAMRALRFGTPGSWRGSLGRELRDSQRHLAQLLIQVVGYRRLVFEESLHGKLTETSSVGGADLAWALGRIGTAASVPVLRSLFDNDDEGVREAAAIALMRLGDDWPLRRAMQEGARQRWGRRVLAIGGGSRAVPLLLDLVTGNDADAEAVLALGLLGHLTAVAPLLDLLDHPELARPAATALNTITGAELHSPVFVPDVVDPDELNAAQRAAYERDGTVPTRFGRPYGNWERLPLLDEAGWRSWLEENRHRFSRDRRWRFGRPYDAAALVECLRAETTPFAVRAATYEELVVRYGLDLPFEADLLVSQQRRILERIEDWVSRRTRSFLPGEWYFAGALQS